MIKVSDMGVDEQGGKPTEWRTLNRLKKNYNLLSLTTELF